MSREAPQQEPPPDGAAFASPTDFVTYRLARLSAKLTTQASQILQDINGLTLTEWRIVLLIAAYGPSSSAEIARQADMDAGQFSRKLQALENGGFISANEDPSDNRRRRLDLTPAGRAMHDAAIPIMRRRQAVLLADFSAAERAALFDALDRLSAAAAWRPGAEA